MKLSKEIKQKIIQLKKIRAKADKVEEEIFKYLENKGIDTYNDTFIDSVGTKISYCEFDTAEELEEYLNDFFNRQSQL
ncbi:TPA: hypothetical protein N2D16_002682 [Clostridium botulinum]|nr:hypothetical protein [Clostridium botulinum]